MSRCCVANLTHMLQTSNFDQMHVLVASNNISLSCLEGRIYIITLLNPLPVLIILLLKSIASSRCVEDTPGNTLVHTLAHDKYSPARWVSRKLRPKSKAIPCYTVGLLKSSCLLFVDQRDSRFVLRNCHATDIALTELAAWLEWLLNHPQ